MEEYSGGKKLIPIGQTPMESNIDDEIKLYRPKKRGRSAILHSAFFRLGRFVLLVGAFFAVYYCLYQLYLKNATGEEDIPASALPEQSSEEETTEKYEMRLPLIINESGKETDFASILKEESYFRLPPGDGIKVIIVNTHPSETVADGITAAEMAEELLKLLQSRGISAYLDNTQYDAQGVIGAYKRMSENVEKLKDIYKEAVVVIDLHDSDSGARYTFTVGTSDCFAWQENLRFSGAIYRSMNCTDAAFRMLPTSLGQDNCLLNVNIGIGSSECTALETRELLSAFCDALVEILQNEPLE